MRRLALVLTATLGSCGGDGPVAEPTAGTDAVEVYVAREVVSIGSLEGDVSFLFGGVTDAHLLSDGRIVVADCQAGELRYFDLDGSHLQTIGRIGDGPGEFRFLSRIFPVRDDSLAVYDGLAGRVSVFSADGKFARSFHAGGMGGRFMIRGALGDGRWVGRVTPDRPDSIVGSIFAAPESFVLLDPGGAVTDTLGPFPGTEEVADDRGLSFFVRLGRQSRLAVGLRGLAHSVGDQSGVLIFSSSVEDSTRFRPLADRRPRAGDEEYLWDQAFETRAAFPEGATSGPAYSRVFADSLPTHGDMYLDRDGAVWLQDPSTPWSFSLMWTRYVDGAPSMRVRLPPRFHPFELHPDGVLGVTFDELTVERVQLLELLRGDTLPASGPPREFQPPWIGRCSFGLSR